MNVFYIHVVPQYNQWYQLFCHIFFMSSAALGFWLFEVQPSQSLFKLEFVAPLETQLLHLNCRTIYTIPGKRVSLFYSCCYVPSENTILKNVRKIQKGYSMSWWFLSEWTNSNSWCNNIDLPVSSRASTNVER